MFIMCKIQYTLTCHCGPHNTKKGKTTLGYCLFIRRGDVGTQMDVFILKFLFLCFFFFLFLWQLKIPLEVTRKILYYIYRWCVCVCIYIYLSCGGVGRNAHCKNTYSITMAAAAIHCLNREQQNISQKLTSPPCKRRKCRKSFCGYNDIKKTKWK